MFLDARKDPFVKVGTFGTPEMAHLGRMLLEAHDIECRLADEYTVSVNLYFSNAVGGVKLMVRQSELREAIDLLQEMEPASDALPGESCPRCGSTDLTFGRLKLLAVIFVILAIDLPPPVASSRACYSCGHRWKVNTDPQ